jgi:hypothetical protein
VTEKGIESARTCAISKKPLVFDFIRKRKRFRSGSRQLRCNVTFIFLRKSQFVNEWTRMRKNVA